MGRDPVQHEGIIQRHRKEKKYVKSRSEKVFEYHLESIEIALLESEAKTDCFNQLSKYSEVKSPGMSDSLRHCGL